MSGSGKPPLAEAATGGVLTDPGPLLRLVKDRRIAFGVVGAVNTAIGFCLYVVLWHVFGVPYLVAFTAAFVVALLCAFWLHRHLVFRVHGHLWRDLLRFTMVNLGAFLANLAVLPLAVEVVGLNPLVAQAVITVATVALSYIGHRDFSFRRPRPSSS